MCVKTTVDEISTLACISAQSKINVRSCYHVFYLSSSSPEKSKRLQNEN